MDIGICVPSHVGDIGYVVRAEELGYSHAWLADSQMIWSDCYAALALAADRTKNTADRLREITLNFWVLFQMKNC